MSTLVLRAESEGELVRLKSPAVGTFTCAVPSGRALVAGQSAGTLVTLGRSFELIVPEGVSGVVISAAPQEVHAPVAFGSTLYELGALAPGAMQETATPPAASAGSGLVFRSPSAGRFWHRSAPGEPALVKAGDVLEPGRALGLIEVMKTFTLVHYATAGGLPARARVVRVLAADGAEVDDKGALFELEPA